MNKANLRDKKILVLGNGISGQGACQALKTKGSVVDVFDDKQNDIKPFYNKLNSYDLIITSPTIPFDHKLIKRANQLHISIKSEIDLAVDLVNAPIIAVSGTNGKTTTVQLLAQIMARQGFKTSVAGNIGISASLSAVREPDTELWIWELSSFQLAWSKAVKPLIAIITNVGQDHLDIHKSLDNYVEAKFSIACNQVKSDDLFLNIDDIPQEYIDKYTKNLQSRIIFNSIKQKTNGCYILNDKIYFKEQFICNINNLPNKSNIFLSNLVHCVAASKVLNIDNDIIISAIKDFKVDKYRLEYIGNIKNKDWYNDSKGTNIDACVKAIESMTGDTTLILGGSDKGEDFNRLFNSLSSRIKNIVVMGATKDKIVECAKLSRYDNISIASNLNDAVMQSVALNNPTVLFSPACASFDCYKDYKDRGEQFCHIVNNL